VPIIACYECQVVHYSRGCQQAIDDRNRPNGAHTPPFVGDCVVDTQHATAKCGFDLREPTLERRGLLGNVWPCKLDPLTDLSENKHAQEEIIIGDRTVPSRNLLIAPGSLAHLGNDVGVQKVGHRSTSRPTSWLRSRSIPSSGADASSAFRLTVGGSTNRRRRSARAAAWSAGSDNAAATRRTSTASSLRTFTSTRTSPARALRARCLASEDRTLLAISGNYTGNDQSRQFCRFLRG
jgi:hypothetical protein